MQRPPGTSAGEPGAEQLFRVLGINRLPVCRHIVDRRDRYTRLTMLIFGTAAPTRAQRATVHTR